MKNFLTLLICIFSLNLHAAETWTEVPSVSGNGTIPIFSMTQDDATATVVLVPGGPFIIGNKDPKTGRPDGINFVVRSAGQFFSEKMNVVVMGKPEKGGDLRFGKNRQSDSHASDVLEVVKFATNAKKPVWLIGTSLGSMSIAKAAVLDRENIVAGIVLSSTVFRSKDGLGVLSIDTNNLKIPVLVSHHAKDACPETNPKMIDELKERFSSSKNFTISLITAGDSPKGKPCGPTHWHGFVNAETETVRSIAEFIRNN